jgi:threonylcarbamoyladenosine tRNA methylthiotransferase MtaB
VLVQARAMLAQGQREIVLTGVNIGHYGLTPIASVDEIASQAHFKRSRQYQPIPGHQRLWDLIDALLGLLEGHLRESGVFARLRISSIEPEDIAERFFDSFSHPHMCPHLHLPLQSGSENVLSAMRRQYTLDTYMRRAEAFRGSAPHGALTTDVITGHPGETEADFEATLRACSELGFERVHGFPFSPRPGTRAALELRSGGAPPPSAGDLDWAASRRPHHFDASIAQERNRRLIAHCAAVAEARWSRMLGRAARVLIESRSRGIYEGYGEAYQHVRVRAEHLDGAPGANGAGGLIGEMFDLRMDGVLDGVFSVASPVRLGAAC